MEKLSSLSRSLAELKAVEGIVLYGSHARGEAGPKSDIDLLVLVGKRTSELERKINDLIDRAKVGRRVVQSVMTRRELAKDPYYKFDILRDGIVLYKRPGLLELPFALKERAVSVYTFDMSKRSQSERVRLNRALYGGTYRKKLKSGKTREYRYEGILEEIGGRKLGRGSLLVPAKGEKKIEALLEEHHVPYQKIHLIMVEEE